MLENFLKQLAKVLQFSDLKPDAYGACLIMLKENQISLLFELDDELIPNTILVSSSLLAFPIEYRSDIYQICLKGNSLQDETLSIRPDEDIVYMHRRFHPSLEAEDLKFLLDQYIDHFTSWKKRLENCLQNPPSISKNLAPGIQIFPFKA